MATSDGRRVTRPYRKASEYLTNKQATYNGPRTITALENENAELREKLTTSVRRLENMEVEFEQSREYFATQLDIATDKLNRTTQALKMLQGSYSELQSINYELEQRVLKVNHLENEKSQLTTDIHDLTNKLTETRSTLHKAQKENERLRKDCNLAVQLLECNAGNFKQQKAKELPRPLQQRVEEYQMDLSQYNEYINPYAADSDGEMEASQPRMGGYDHASDAIPTELLAKVLQKPENVHMNVEDTDYIQDPELNSMYKGRITDKKLVKYDYDTPESSVPRNQQKSATMPRSSNENNNRQGRSKDESRMPRSSSGVESSSPWELAPVDPSSGTDSGGSPWEMSGEVQGEHEEDIDYGAASAYGAFPVSYRRPRTKTSSSVSRRNPQSTPKVEPPTQRKGTSYNKSKMSTSYHKATSPNSQKGTGENQDVYISQTYKQHDDGGNAAKRESDDSNANSRKTTPAKVPVDVERGTSAEKSSLLDRVASDEEDMVMTVELGGREPSKVTMMSPGKDYVGVKTDKEVRGLLQGDDSDRETDERELDEEGNVREFDEEKVDGMREYEEETSLREPIKHDIPEFDLLNLDDSVIVIGSNQNSPAHQIMMQHTLLSNDLESLLNDLPSETLLPNIPPPSGFSELILDGSLPAPPPPDMFGGSDHMPMAHPSALNQSGPGDIAAQSTVGEQSAIVLSQVPATTSLDDLKVLVDIELRSPQKKSKSTSNVTETQRQESAVVQPPTVDPSVACKSVREENRAISSELVDDHDTSPQVKHNMDVQSSPGHEMPLGVADDNETSSGENDSDDTPPESVNHKDVLNQKQAEDVPASMCESATPSDGACSDEPISGITELCADNALGELLNQNVDSGTPSVSTESYVQHGPYETPDHKEGQKVGDYAASPSHDGRIEPPTQSVNIVTPGGSFASRVENGSMEPSNLENVPLSGSTATYDIVTDDDDIVADDTDSPSNCTTDEKSDCAVDGTDGSGPNRPDPGPMEVVTLYEEPRGGNYNRRRRNSFEQAKEFGSIMDD